MKIIVEKSSLFKALSHVQSVVERRTTIPILSNVLITAAEDGLKLNATDMDLEIIETVMAEVISAGSTTVPAHTIYDIIRKLPDGSQIELSYDGEAQMILLSGRSRFKLPCLPVADFPALAEDDFTHKFSISSNDLRLLIDRTRFAISTEETRYYLNGIYFHQSSSGDISVLRSVATDGHRMARVEIPLPEGADGMPGVIVPRKAVNEIRKLIDEADQDIGVAMSGSKICFSVSGTTLTSKLIDGTFPDYDRVIPINNDKVLETDCKVLGSAVDRVSAISAEKSRSIKLNIEKGLVVLSATSPDSGSASEEVEVSYNDTQLEIGFNSRYLLDIMQQIEGDSVRLMLADAASPTIISDVSDGSAVYVLMPMRV